MRLLFCFKSAANNRIELVFLCLCTPGEDDAPAAVRPAVHLIGGGVEVQRETKGEATVHTGHAAGTGGMIITRFSSSTAGALLIHLGY